MRLGIIITVALLATGCSQAKSDTEGKTDPTTESPRDRIVKIGWDPPAVAAARYQVFVDDRVVQETPPPPMDAACQCLVVSVSVPSGPHVVKVVAIGADGRASTPATLNVQ